MAQCLYLYSLSALKQVVAMTNFPYTDRFTSRHIGPSDQEVNEMLQEVGASDLSQLIDEALPASIRLKEDLRLPEAVSEYEFIQHFRALAKHNQVFKSYIGTGYSNCITPPVILRNVLENPGWYTAYTPYQAEIAQGRLEALINYQTMVTDLTGMELANASLLDEGTAAAEAMTMLYALRKGEKKNAHKFFVSEKCHPQTIDVLKTRAIPLGIELVFGSVSNLDLSQSDLFGSSIFGVLIQYPNTDGKVIDYENFISQAHSQGIFVTMAADLLALTLLKSPGEMGADVVVGTSQRLGVPMGYGGPHAGYFATKEQFKRQIPGRIIGVSLDSNGKKAYRMALQTREQHIRREKATSNICTAQVLLAVISGFYAVYHGKNGLRQIGQRVQDLTSTLAASLSACGFVQLHEQYFDTLLIEVADTKLLKSIAENAELNFRYFDNKTVSVSLDETTSEDDVKCIIKVFLKSIDKSFSDELFVVKTNAGISNQIARKTSYLDHEVFNKYRSEHDMLRYLKSLENKDLSLAHSMISLGSCTMKLNATTEMIPVTWAEFGGMHPFAPVEQTGGYQEMFRQLNQWLSEITGFSAVSFQPNSGAQGEYAGLMVIRAFHKAKGQDYRNVVLIPSSAHGTNPASAVMAGMKVVVVKCDEKGNIDHADLKEKVLTHSEKLSALMVTYPSTHGVFEEGIIEVCELIHEHGGQVYMDGANMNAQVGLTSPGFIGADVCHLNLHKTFCIPHGGGGPGVGPIGVAEHLVPFLPGHAVIETGGKQAITAISAAPWGSASILPISYAYIAMMGGQGLKKATEIAILNANYIMSRLQLHYPILYTGTNGRCAHEMIVDFRQFKQELGVEVEDVAKRLMDYGFHAPTVSFPVAGTLMIEPTESESKVEIDRFCDALINIRQEIQEIADGKSDTQVNVLKNAPHTIGVITSDEWDLPYSRSQAAYPVESLREAKFWPYVGRIDSAHGDRNLICTCEPIESYAEEV